VLRCRGDGLSRQLPSVLETAQSGFSIRPRRHPLFGVQKMPGPIRLIECWRVAADHVDGILQKTKPAIVRILFQRLPNDRRRLSHATELQISQRHVAAIDRVLATHHARRLVLGKRPFELAKLSVGGGQPVPSGAFPRKLLNPSLADLACPFRISGYAKVILRGDEEPLPIADAIAQLVGSPRRLGRAIRLIERTVDQT
jgi:hypothetical protein